MKSKYILLLFLLTTGIRKATAQVVTAAQVNGNWEEMNNDPRGVSSRFTIKALGGGKLQVQFRGNNAARGFSNVLKGVATITGTTALFKPKDGQVDPDNPCVITLKFVDGTLMVTESGDCGWGAGIAAEGTYFKKVKE